MKSMTEWIFELEQFMENCIGTNHILAQTFSQNFKFQDVELLGTVYRFP